MTASQHADEPVRAVVQKSLWLPALEQELKSRVGWADEAVSPFAGKRRPAPAEPKISPNAVRTETTPRAA